MEQLMQYVWQHRLGIHRDMHTVDGRRIQVLDPGRLNTDAGPDFFNAKIKIDGQIWAGDVEIHVKASDWFRHHHDTDPAYDSVILHVVDRDDAQVSRSDGEVIPQVVMPCAPEFRRHYDEMVMRADIDLPCAPYISQIPQIYITDWISSLMYERLYAKTDRITEILNRMSGDWESACYITVARCLGFGVNGEPFQRLAYSLPLRFIGKHADSLTAIEALLFGRSGLLDEAPQGDAYVDRLRSEYQFLSHKFGLSQGERLGWKMARMRPANSPHRRIALLAALLHGGFRMMSRILEVKSVDQAVSLFSPTLSQYWSTHYNFNAPSAHPVTASALSRQSIESLVINAVVPLQYAYGSARGDVDAIDDAIALLQDVKPERNAIVDLFERAGIKPTDASWTQAVIQLRREYCEQRKCLYCRIGHRVLASHALRR